MSTIGRYQIKSELGRGGMATVYLAFDPRFDREVAIKVLPREFLHDAQFRGRFEREAKLIAALEDPAIVPVHDYGEEAGQPYLVMRYMAGGSLSDRLRQGPLSLAEVASLLARLAPALDKAHQRGVVHRDLKPANILFDRDGNPHIADFGIAKLLESSANFTNTGIIGTPAYMSPEQVEAERSLDGRSDVYSLGVMLYEMLAGRPPYDADTPMGLALMHLRKPVPHVRQVVPGLSPVVDEVIATALAKDREQRYPTAGALAAALTRAANSNVPLTRVVPPPKRVESRPPTPPLPAPRSLSSPARRSRWTALLLGLVGLLAVVVLYATSLSGSGSAQVTPTPTRTDAPQATLPVTNTPLSLSDTPAPIAGVDETSLPPTDTPIPPTDTPAPATDTPESPTSTPLPPSDTPIPSTATPMLDAEVNTPNANLRAGPGTGYDRLGSYPAGSAVEVVGKTPSGDWLQVKASDGKIGWMAQSVLLVNVDLSQVAMATLPPTPTIPAARAQPSPAAGDMIFVPAGEFLMGSPEYVGEGPQHTVHLDAFYIDKTEVTAAQYQRCVEAGACSVAGTGGTCTYGDSGKPDHPINCVDWNQAIAYCQWAGKRLPTEAEWEKTARGVDGREYPWGNQTPDATRANFNNNVGRTTSVGQYPADVSPYGALDMAGNVWEWVADWYDENYYTQSPRKNPQGPTSGQGRVSRGGSWVSAGLGGQTAHRGGMSPDASFAYLGFRCAGSS